MLDVTFTMLPANAPSTSLNLSLLILFAIKISQAVHMFFTR